MLALKILLLPTIIGIVSLVGKRWGPGVAGWLAGFPSVIASVLIFVALERGPDFTAVAAKTSLLALIATVVFGVTYARACVRLGWVASVAISMGAWHVASVCFIPLLSHPYLSLGIAVCSVAVALRIIPKSRLELSNNALPSSELWLRMVCGAVLTVLTSLLAARIGPAWSGLLAGFPVLLIVLAIFSHRTNGAAFVIPMIRAVVAGLNSAFVFCFMLEMLLPRLGNARSFLIAMITAMAIHCGLRLIGERKNACAVTIQN